MKNFPLDRGQIERNPSRKPCVEKLSKILGELQVGKGGLPPLWLNGSHPQRGQAALPYLKTGLLELFELNSTDI